MSNQDLERGDVDFASPVPSVGRWNSVLGTVGLVLVGSFLFWISAGSPEVVAEDSVVESQTVIRWRQTPVFSLAWSPDNRKLAASCFGPVIRVWDRETGRVTSHEGGTEQPRFALGWSEDGRELMVSGLDLPIESWNLSEMDAGEGLGVARPCDRMASTQALIRTTGARPIRLWGPSDKRFGLLASEGRLTNSIAFSPDGRFHARGGVEGWLEIHETSKGTLRWKTEVDPRGISAVSFSPDGTKVATSGPGPVIIWDLASAQQLHRLGDERSGAATLGFSPEGSRLAVANWDGSIVIWDLATATPMCKLRGDHGQILSLAWSPDGKTLASGGYDSSVRVWNLAPSVLKTASR